MIDRLETVVNQNHQDPISIYKTIDEGTKPSDVAPKSSPTADIQNGAKHSQISPMTSDNGMGATLEHHSLSGAPLNYAASMYSIPAITEPIVNSDLSTQPPLADTAPAVSEITPTIEDTPVAAEAEAASAAPATGIAATDATDERTDTGPIYSGNFTVCNEADLAKLAQYSSITGSLNIADTSLTSIASLSSLTSIGGKLTISNNSELTGYRHKAGQSAIVRMCPNSVHT